MRKVVDDPAVTSGQDFRFTGNISYTTDHAFTLTASNGKPASATFFRGANGEPWTFQEQIPPGWSLTGLSCASATGASTSTTNVGTGATSVALGAGDTVTCTYTNRATPPPAGLQLIKRTLDGVGTFTFNVAGPDSGTQTITTTQAGVAVAGAPLKGTPGNYRITEGLPSLAPGGYWSRTAVSCNGAAFDPLRPVQLTIPAGTGAACTFTNRFVHTGRIGVNKVTSGGTGDRALPDRRAASSGASYQQVAAVRRPVRPLRATGDDTTKLPLGEYSIIESGQRITPRGHWTLDGVLCDGRPQAVAQGRRRDPAHGSRPHEGLHVPGHRSTAARNRRTRTPGRPRPRRPTPGPNPTPVPTPSPEEANAASGPNADLVVTKRVSPRVAQPGEPVTYTVKVTNQGPDIAYDVVVTEVQAPGSQSLDISTSQGTCTGERPAHCAIGKLEVGESATITVKTTARASGTNRVATASSTGDPVLANNLATATLIVRRAPGVTG